MIRVSPESTDTGLASRREGGVTTDGCKICEHPGECSAFLAKSSPDLALIIAVWASQPEAIRAGIVAIAKIVKTSANRGGGQGR